MTAVEEATALKQKGNAAFANHDWPTAIDYYTQAIEKNGKDPSFYCNRAQVANPRPKTLCALMLMHAAYRLTLNSNPMATP